MCKFNQEGRGAGEKEGGEGEKEGGEGEKEGGEGECARESKAGITLLAMTKETDPL